MVCVVFSLPSHVLSFFLFSPYCLFHSSEEFFHLRMQNQNSLKKEFLKKWIRGLQICNASKENVPLLERKKAIKLSADLAMASTTRNANKHWSRALICKASKVSETRSLAKQILQDSTIKANCSSYNYTKQHKTSLIRARRGNNKYTGPTTSRKYGLRTKSFPQNSCSKVMKARSIAKMLVKKRTKILKGLVPGGEYMDEYSLVKETRDYIVSLRAQVEVMHYLANTPQLSIQMFDS